MLDPTEIAQRRMQEEYRRSMQRDEAVHKAAMLALFYTELVKGGVAEDEAISLTQVWLEQGMGL